MPIDIGQLLESHRRYLLELVAEAGEESLTEEEVQALGFFHDRATTKTLLDLYRQGLAPNGEVRPTGQASASATLAASPLKSRAIKPGSKRAKERAAKAQQTRLRNLNKAAAVTPPDEAPLSPATHLTPIPGGAA